MAELIYAGDGGAFKTCTKCKRFLQSIRFRLTKRGAFGFHSWCRDCEAQYTREWYSKPENRTAAAERWKAYYAENREHIIEWNQAYREEDPGRANLIARKSREKHRVAFNLRRAERRRSDPATTREVGRMEGAKRRASPKFRLEKSVSAAIYAGVRRGTKAGRSAFSLLGYSAEELMAHLERQFLPGMTWGNRGRGKNCWHIDHIRPLSSFNYSTPECDDFKRAWALTNLRPLWEHDNLSKGAKILTLV